MSYNPGKHLIATLHSNDKGKLEHSELCSGLINELIAKHKLQKLGEVYHNFKPGGFTAVVCLSESHISLHTWPEFNKINLDIYLSNYLRENHETVELIFKEIQKFFIAEIIQYTTILR